MLLATEQLKLEIALSMSEDVFPKNGSIKYSKTVTEFSEDGYYTVFVKGIGVISLLLQVVHFTGDALFVTKTFNNF